MLKSLMLATPMSAAVCIMPKLHLKAMANPLRAIAPAEDPAGKRSRVCFTGSNLQTAR